jgi:3-deoxy-manno-octulosonate cytidylyltransferase (CMP-KDO synthetase)
MSVLILIPARMGSSRFPGKPLALIEGKTLIQRVCERASRLPEIEEIRVATDHREILAHVRELGFRCIMTGDHHSSGTDRIAEILGDWDQLVLNLQGDEPLFDLVAVTALIEKMTADTSIPMGTVALPLGSGDLDSPDRVKALRRPDGFAADFRRRLEGIDPGESEVLLHAGIYLFRADALRRFVATAPTSREKSEHLEQLRAVESGTPIWIQKGYHRAPGVDRPDDLKTIAMLLREG